jgi:dimethylargininase
MPIDVGRARDQHAGYERALESAGCTVHRLSAQDALPDAVFIEDTAIVLDEIAIIARPGAESRRAETAGIEEVLKRYRLLGHITAPGTVDGGDVLVAGRMVFVGQSVRTNPEGIEQLRRIVEYFGYTVQAVPVAGCVHLKSAVTAAGNGMLVMNPAWIDPGEFSGFEIIEVPEDEGAAANVLAVNGRVLCAEGFPRTREGLERRGVQTTAVDVSELAKAEGAITCCSLLVNP